MLMKKCCFLKISTIYKLITILAFIVMIRLSFYIIFSHYRYVGNDVKIALIISLFGLSFAIFQFLISEINTHARWKSDRRFQASNDIIKILDSIGELIIKELVNHKKDPNGTMIGLMNQKNAFSTTVLHINKNKTLFPKITNKTEFIHLNDILDELYKTVVEFNKKWPKEIRSIDESMDFAVYGMILENRKKMGKILKEFYEKKQNFYTLLSCYF